MRKITKQESTENNITEISDAFNFESKYLEIDGIKIHYVEEGHGEVVLFIHGCPTSSYLWRNIIPFVSNNQRAIAFDLIGMGKSDKLSEPVNFQQNMIVLEKFISALGLENITLVLHDWGAALGFELARRQTKIIKAICFMEGVLPPKFPEKTFDGMGVDIGDLFRAFKDPEQGKEMIIKQNFFIESTLPHFINRKLDDKTWEHYRKPFVKEKDRIGLLTWPIELPIEGEPARNVELMADIQQFIKSTTLPMLLLYCDPGTLITADLIPWYQENITNLQTKYVGKATHFIQEDKPVEIGQSISIWLQGL
jgi:haloalkane dehalogenase